MPRRLLAVVALLAALCAGVRTACGSDSKTAAGPRAEVLSYFPDKAGLVALVSTDIAHGQIAQARKLADRFPGSGIAIAQLRSQLLKGGLDYERDVKPLLGNEVAVGAARPGGLESNGVLLVLDASDEGKLSDVIDRQVKAGKLKADGDHAGAKLYSTGTGTELARSGSTLLVADGAAVLNAALDRHEAGDGMTPGRFEDGLGDLPKDALVRVVGDGHQLLSGARAAQAKRVPWLAALGPFAFTVRAADDGVHVAFRADTRSGSLSDADVPLATGAAAPRVQGNGDVLVGIRDLSHIIAFAQRAAQAVSPASFARFTADKARIRDRIGVDLDRDVVGQLTGSATVTTDLHSFGLVADLRDAKAMAATLRKLTPVMPAFLEGAGIPGARVRFLGDDTWEVSRDGQSLFTYAVAAAKLVAGNMSGGDLQALARAPATSIPGAHGAVALKVSGESLRRLVGQRLGLGALGGLALGALGDITGWVQASTDGLRGEFKLAING